MPGSPSARSATRPTGTTRRPAGELGEERCAGLDLGAGGRAVGRRLAGPVRVRGHGVPEQDVLLDPQLTQDAVDDRRRGLGRAAAHELAL